MKKSLTYEQLLQLHEQSLERSARIEAYLERLAIENEQRAAENEQRAAENEQRAAEHEAYLKKLADESAAESKKRATEREQRAAEFAVETKRLIAENDRLIKRLARQIGEVSDTLGRFAEEQVRPMIARLFEKYGIILNETHQRIRVLRNGEFFLEIDLLLVNTIYSVVVEVKHTLRHRDIDNHLLRLSKLEEHPSSAIKGTTMYGAVAGMIVSDEVEQYAMKNGLYVIKTKGENVSISNPTDFVPKQWIAPPNKNYP